MHLQYHGTEPKKVQYDVLYHVVRGMWYKYFLQKTINAITSNPGQIYALRSTTTAPSWEGLLSQLLCRKDTAIGATSQPFHHFHNPTQLPWLRKCRASTFIHGLFTEVGGDISCLQKSDQVLSYCREVLRVADLDFSNGI
jgi:hypothetical protein